MSTLDLIAIGLLVLSAVVLCAWIDLATLIRKLETHMADATARIQAAVDATKAALANIAADIAKLKADVAAGAPTEDVLASLDALAVSAQAIADATPDAPMGPQ